MEMQIPSTRLFLNEIPESHGIVHFSNRGFEFGSPIESIKYDVDLSCFDYLNPLVLRAMARHLDMALAAKLPVPYRPWSYRPWRGR